MGVCYCSLYSSVCFKYWSAEIKWWGGEGRLETDQGGLGCQSEKLGFIF